MSAFQSIYYSLVLLSAVIFTGCAAPLQVSMREIAPGVFDGPRPGTQDDFAVLRQHGIRTLVSLEVFTFDVAPVRRRAEQNHIRFINIPVAAAPWAPSEEKVKLLLQTLANTNLQPIYVHCLMGRDRTGVLLALYRVYYCSCAPEEAWEQMLHKGGFKSSWGLAGFKRYFWDHTKIPDWAQQTDLASQAKDPSGHGLRGDTGITQGKCK